MLTAIAAAINLNIFHS